MKLRATLTIRNEAMIAARERLGFSQATVAELADCGTGIIGQLESLNFKHRDIQQIADRVALVLELDPEQVLPQEMAGEVYQSRHFRTFEQDPRLLPKVEDTKMLLEFDETMNKEELARKVDQVLKTLTYREREILKLRYGLGDNDGNTYTLEEVGRIFRVTRERVREVEARAIRKLQHPVRARRLESFLPGGGHA